MAQCLCSVQAQSYAHWQVIFFDSASEDASLAVAQAFSQKDARIRCIAHDSRPILGEARRLALKYAVKYAQEHIAEEKAMHHITFLDVDDLWHKDKLALQVAHMQSHAQVDVLCTNADFFYGSTYGQKFLRKSVFSKSRPASGAVFEELIQRQWILLSSVMLRRTALEKLETHTFDSRLQLAADADLLYRLAQQGYCDFVPRVLTHRRMHSHNITLSQWEEWPQEIQYILDKFRALWPNFDKEYPKATKAMQKRIAFQQSIQYWRQGQGRLARKVLREQRPLNSKIALFYALSFFSPKIFSWAARNYWRLPSFFLK